MPGRRRLLLGTAVAAVGLGAIASILVPGRTGTDIVPSSPSGLARGSSTPAAVGSASPLSSQSQSPGPGTTRGPIRTFRPLGAPIDAVVVRVIGDAKRPDEVEVALVALGVGAFDAELQAQVIARLPGSAIPDGLVLTDARAKYSDGGWIALDVENPATSDRSILIFDIGAPRSAPWVVPGRLPRAAWGPGSVLAVVDAATVHLYEPIGRSVVSVDIPNQVVLGGTPDDRNVPPTWLPEGNGFLAWAGRHRSPVRPVRPGRLFHPDRCAACHLPVERRGAPVVTEWVGHREELPDRGRLRARGLRRPGTACRLVFGGSAARGDLGLRLGRRGRRDLVALRPHDRRRADGLRARARRRAQPVG